MLYTAEIFDRETGAPIVAHVGYGHAAVRMAADAEERRAGSGAIRREVTGHHYADAAVSTLRAHGFAAPDAREIDTAPSVTTVLAPDTSRAWRVTVATDDGVTVTRDYVGTSRGVARTDLVRIAESDGARAGRVTVEEIAPSDARGHRTDAPRTAARRTR